MQFVTIGLDDYKHRAWLDKDRTALSASTTVTLIRTVHASVLPVW